MKKKMLLIPILILLLSACGDAAPAAESTATPLPATEVPDAEPAGETDDNQLVPRPTVTPLPDDDTTPGYPTVPTATSFPEGYQAAAVEPTADPYPSVEGFVWISRAAGEQCAEKLDYPTLETAVSALSELAVNINAQTTANLGVCEACGCPTSLHYRVQIPAEEVPLAETLGWLAED